jgi:hypothetical protein
MHKVKVSYIVQSSLAVGAYALLAVFASIKFASAGQLSLVTKVVFIGFLWMVAIHIVYVFIRDYKKLDNYDLDSKNDAPWTKR